MKVYSSANVENVTVGVRGIGGMMNEKRIVSLSEGMNEVSFIYKLPRCNSCGGIRAGKYSLDGVVVYGNMSVKDSLSVDIQQ